MSRSNFVKCRTLHSMGIGYVLAIEDISWFKEVINIKTLILPSKIQLYYSPSKYQYY